MNSSVCGCPTCGMPVRRSADLCGSCHARPPKDGWPVAELHNGVGTQTHSLLQQALGDEFCVADLQDVSPLRWVYRATRGPDGAAPLSVYVLVAPIDESRTNVWIQPTLSARIGSKASHMQQVLATGRLDEDRIYVVLTPAPTSSLADSLSDGSFPLRRALRIAADVCAAWARLQELGQCLGPVPTQRICLEPRWNGSDDLRILAAWFLGPEGQEWEAVDGVVPPEWRPGLDSPATDAFSVGALLYRAITQHLPYSAQARRVAQRQGEPPEWVPIRVPPADGPVPPGLDNLLREMLHYDPMARPTDARRLHDVLLAMLESSTAPTVSPVMLLSDLTDVPAVTRTAAPPVRQRPRLTPRPVTRAVAGSARQDVITEERPPRFGRTPAPAGPVGAMAFSAPRAPTPVSMTARPAVDRALGSPVVPTQAPSSVRWFAAAFVGTSMLAVMVALIVWLALPLPGRLVDGGPYSVSDPLSPIPFDTPSGPSLMSVAHPSLSAVPEPSLHAVAHPRSGPQAVVVQELVPEQPSDSKARNRRRRRVQPVVEAMRTEPVVDAISPEENPRKTLV
ncbi:MAG: hypothetical protein AB8H79_14020, partial [Myxococcota bacterium]